MSESLIEAAPVKAGNGEADNGEAAAADAEAGGAPVSLRPQTLPEKFWDEERGEVRTEAMIKSYLELERKLGSHGGLNIPESPDGYEIKAPNEMITPDRSVNACLHKAGFTNEQVQTVYDLAGERMMPLAVEIAAKFEAQKEVDRLSEKFGGENKWRETARQIGKWGEKNLAPEVFGPLSTSYEGVLNLHRMMTNGEPEIGRGGDTAGGVTSEAGIKEMMRDPRYWRDHDPAFVEKVQHGFKRLFPNEG
ncbi:MAG: hypothetical protein A3G18_10295 [Rhodospirillales bacterium RIFCSPLOWO2_12_FULL_58_28]|nr:MAG: hypothetical protein A3H92_08470 [Rhodospirillales bacterium RIFCSPLOWO2_02_FULL_58_16]OHC77668.1 MAG: hypothetical protein A3G18_10295 [Rhodospirillales bacterium RIFCSPLOWO2_12_FULL_58_28]